MNAGKPATRVPGTIALAIAAKRHELLCTGGFPRVCTRVLTLNEPDTAGCDGYPVFYSLTDVVDPHRAGIHLHAWDGQAQGK